MAKKKEKSLSDFDAEDLLKVEIAEEDQEEKDETSDEEESEEEEEEKPKSKDKSKFVKKEVEVKKPKPTPTPTKAVKEVKKDTKQEEEEEEEEVITEEVIDKEEEEDQGENPEEFYKAVEKITGSQIEVDYDDIDPLSAQGVAIREKAVSETAVNSFLDQLEAKHPKVYRAFEHAMAGGNLEDLFSPGEKDYSKVEIKEDDEDHAKIVLKEYYQKKGVADTRIKRMIEADEESEEGLVKSAQAALAEMKTAQEKEAAQKFEEQKIRGQRQAAQDQRFLEDVDKIVSSLQISTFRIPSKREADEFSDFVRNSIQRDGKGGYLFVTPVEPGSIEKQLQTEYFRFKKGDLEKLITTKATTKLAEGTRLRLKKQEATVRTTVEETKKKVKSMKDFEV